MKNKRKRTCDNPWKLSFQLIKRITNNFSEELGRGAFGQVFKGVLEDGEEVAVKMLRFMGNINDNQFENEFEILKRLEHPNIVRLVGFCDEAEELTEYKGKLIVCHRIHRALCLEYMPNRSLGKLLSGENLDKNWPIRYRMIKGICEGLEYLQEGLKFPIFHLDLKPDNILLNEEMMPKISDFGQSRLIGEENSKRTLTPLGTLGYLPPEFTNYQVISKEYDIYSLGVIITKIITGIKGYSDVADMGAQEFVEHVHEKWKKCLQEIPMYASLEVDCYQVKRCIVIARRCMENDRHKRPIIKDIVSDLDQMGNFKLNSQLPLEKVSLLPIRKKKIMIKTSSCSDYPVRLEGACSAGSPDGIYHGGNQTFPDWSPDNFGFLEEELDLELHLGLGLGWMPGQQNVCEAPKQTGTEKQKRGNVHIDPHPSEISHPWAGSSRQPSRKPVISKKQISTTNMHKDPPSEISNPAHPEHKLKLMTDAGAPFLCDGCKEPGYGPRYTCDCGGGGHTFDLHTRCALADDPVFDLHTLVHPLFGYGKHFEFRFLQEAPSSPVQEEGRRVCDACGDPTRGFVYHSLEEGLDLHPCCASLPDRFLHDGRAFDLHRRATRPCVLCPDNEGQRRCFWAYRCYLDGDEAAVDLHVACLKETARRSWEACYRNQDVGDGALNVDSMLENMFSSTFGDIAGTLASFITALVFGSLIVNM